MKKTLFILFIMCVCFIYSCTKTEMESAKQQIEIRNEIEEDPGVRYTVSKCTLPDGTIGWRCPQGPHAHCRSYLPTCRPFWNSDSKYTFIELISINFSQFENLYKEGVFRVSPEKLIDNLD